MRAVVVALLLAAGAADADPEDTMVLELRESISISAPDATAAFSVDPVVAEVSITDGRIVIVARGAGATTISIVTSSDVRSFPVFVSRPPPHDFANHERSSTREWTQWQSNYESSSGRLTNSLEMVDAGARRTLRAYAVNALDLGARTAGDQDARTSMPAMALEWRTENREVVVFDKLIEHSQLTLDGTTVRGGHLRLGGLEVHAGITSPVLYQDVFLSTQRETVLGASYALRAGRSSFTPSVYAFPSTPQTGGTQGTMASLQYKFRSADDRLQLRTELGWGGELGAAGELVYEDAVQHAWISARHQPRGFAALGVGRPLGSMVDAVWITESKRRLSANVAASAARYASGPVDQDVASVSAETRLRIARALSASLGASVGRYRPEPMADVVESLAVPVGLHVDTPRYAASAIYRYQTNTARNRGGHGGRLSARASSGAWHASTFADAQQEAASVELILRDQPVLAGLLNELGLTATTADDLARLLRENATLSQLGYTDGATLSFNPWRAQAGADLGWLPRDGTRRQLRLRVLLDRTRTVGALRDTRSAALSYQRRFGSAVDASLMVSLWSREEPMHARTDAWSVAAGLSVRIDAVPRLRSRKHRAIEGIIVDDHGGGAPMAGVTVRLDGSRAAVTDAAGRFAFPDVAGGAHQVGAELPEDAYFTSPQQVTTEAGGSVRFGVARAQTRLTGVIRDDLGAGIAGISLVIRGGDQAFPVVTDSSGRFRIALLAGDYVVEPSVQSVPPGYETSALAPSPLVVEAGVPAQLELRLPALRSVAGTVRARGAAIRIVELAQQGVIDGQGRYVFRGLPPGRFTVEVTVGTKTLRRPIVIPNGPVSLRGIDF